jgi:hypothetical protein
MDEHSKTKPYVSDKVLLCVVHPVHRGISGCQNAAMEQRLLELESANADLGVQRTHRDAMLDNKHNSNQRSPRE